MYQRIRTQRNTQGYVEWHVLRCAGKGLTDIRFHHGAEDPYEATPILRKLRNHYADASNAILLYSSPRPRRGTINLIIADVTFHPLHSPGCRARHFEPLHGGSGSSHL